MLTFDHARFRYAPYPIGIVRPVVERTLYEEMVRSYPPIDLFAHVSKVGEKYALSEKLNRARYRDFVASTPVWRELHRWIKSPEFIDALDTMLCAHHVDLGLRKRYAMGSKRWSRALKALRRGRLPRRPIRLRARFEFSSLPADGGFITPHTDAQRKILTLVVPVVKEGAWNAGWGGGTDVNRPRSERYAFNWVNQNVPFEDVDVLDSYAFAPNQCIVFVRTFNSLHSVRPMTGSGSQAMRNTLTINVEEDW